MKDKWNCVEVQDISMPHLPKLADNICMQPAYKFSELRLSLSSSPITIGLQTEGGLHHSPGSPGGDLQRLLEDGPRERVWRHRHAHCTTGRTPGS